MTRSFDIGEAIFFFFKRFGSNPMGALWIMVCQALIAGALVALSFWALGPFYMGILDLAAQDAAGHLSDEETAVMLLDLMAPFFTTLPLIGIAGIVSVLMFQGAWLRFLVHNEVAPVIPFRFGGDEFRLLGVNLLYLALGFGLYIAFAVIAVIVGIGSVGAVAGSDGSVGVALGSAVFAFIAIMAAIIVVLLVAVRLATAPALTIRDRKFRFFESWDAAKGVFGNLFVTYLAVAFLILFLSVVVGFVLEMAFLGAALPLIQEFILLASDSHDIDPREVVETITETFSRPGVATTLIIGMSLSYALRMCLEGMWHGVGAYNAVRYRSEDPVESGDAPVLDESHPAGASPSEG